MTGEILAAIAAGLPWAVALAALSFAIGAVLGLGLCAARLSRAPLLRVLAGLAILALRSVPPIVWLFVVLFGSGIRHAGIGPFAAAALGLGLIMAAHLAEAYRGALSAVQAGQWEAAAALNLPMRSRMVDVIGPQSLRLALPAAAASAIGLLRDCAVAATIGVGGMAFQARDAAQRGFHGLDVFAAAAGLSIAFGLPLAVVARWADLRLRARAGR